MRVWSKHRAISSAWLFVSYIILFAALVVAAFPFLWMFLSSFKTNPQIYRIPITLLPPSPTAENYTMLLTGQHIPFLRQFFNSSVIAAIRITVNLLACSAAAYAFAKYTFPLQNVLFMLIIGFLMIPPQITVVPLFLLMNSFGWLDTIQAVALPGAFTAFGVFLLRQVMVSSVPLEIIESARIDGASEFRTFVQLVLRLPAVSSGMIVLATLTFVATWNEYFWPVIALRSSSKFTLPVGLASLVGMYRVEYGMLMAGGFMAVFPVMLFFILGRKTFMQGFTAGAVKG